MKQRKVFQTVATLLLFSLISSCTWVKKTPDAAKVRVVPADLVTNCTNLGTITTSTVNNVSIIKRNIEKVRSELETLAQREAAEMNADTIVATSKVVEGRRSFGAYRCLR